VGLIYDNIIYNHLEMAIQETKQQVMIWYSQIWLTIWAKQVKLCC
jgi:hypothetical protein